MGDVVWLSEDASLFLGGIYDELKSRWVVQLENFVKYVLKIDKSVNVLEGCAKLNVVVLLDEELINLGDISLETKTNNQP